MAVAHWMAKKFVELELVCSLQVSRKHLSRAQTGGQQSCPGSTKPEGTVSTPWGLCEVVTRLGSDCELAEELHALGMQLELSAC